MFAELGAGDPRQLGRYRIVARLGAGGMGQVFLGRSPGGRSVAVKVVRAELAEDTGFRQRFAREVAMARRVTGVFTAAVVDADLDASPAWLATEYVLGISLEEAIAQHGAWPATAVLALGAGLAEALEAIHGAGVVHRDLKPSNVLLASEGPRVIDFGISVADGASALTRTGTVVGTPGFMAPEQLAMGGRVSPASDVFSLGAVLAFAATGSGPFGTGSPHALYYRIVHEEPDLSGLPPVVGAVVARCLAKEPQERPAVAELLEELAGELRSEGQEVPWPHTEHAWLPRPVAIALKEHIRTGTGLPAERGVEGSGVGNGPFAHQAATRSGGAPGPVPAHPPTALAVPAPPTPATPPSPAAPPRAGGTSLRTRRQALAALAGLGAVGIGFTSWKVVGGRESSSGDPSGEGPDEKGASRPEAKSGIQLWSIPDFAVGSGATAADGAVYVSGSAGLEESTALHAFGAADGKPRWTFPLDARFQRPEVADGVVYLTSTGDKLYALDAADGRLRWSFTAPDAPVTTPAVTEGMVYVCGSEGRLFAIDATNGKHRWVYGYPWKKDVLPAAPVAVGGMAYVGDSEGTLHAIDAATGRKRWSHPSTSGSQVFSSAAIADGTAYYTSADGRLYAVDATSGERLWSFRVSDLQPSGAVTADGMVYVHDFTDTLYAVNAADGKLRWSFPLSGSVSLDPAVGGGTVCIATSRTKKSEQSEEYTGGKLYAVDAGTGRERWSFDPVLKTEIRTPLAIADGTVYFGVVDHFQLKNFILYALAL
ncbi:PQQ-binding-like beta-propeller repeat protein [Streptomyces sp. NPDC012389]|uniref:outer membrane protein assembly factor BamB family protein n=1 Tax=Streptomyces sp. NPDC012389 TaxID=3364830 RepID=UPI0036EE55D7